MSFGFEVSLHPLTKVNPFVAHQGWGAQLGDRVSKGGERGWLDPPGGAHTPGLASLRSLTEKWQESFRPSCVPGRPSQRAPDKAWGPHSPVKGILVGVGHVHDVDEATIPCREQLGHGGEGAVLLGLESLAQSRAT